MTWQEKEGLSPFHTTPCDICHDRVEGVLYKCLDCVSLHLCRKCVEDARGTLFHDPALHSLRPLYSPLLQKALPLHTERCSGCGSECYEGKQYTCPSCVFVPVFACALCHAEKRLFCDRVHTKWTEKEPVAETEPVHYLVHYTRWTEKEPVAGNEPIHYKARAVQLQYQLGRQLAQIEWAKRDLRQEGQRKTTVPDEHGGQCATLADETVNAGIKIGYAIYGPPETEQGGEYGYDKEKDAKIEMLLNVLIELERKKGRSGESVEIKFVFASYYHKDAKEEKSFQGTLALIVLRGSGGERQYVEPSGRTYADWNDFLKHNHLPKADLVVPSGGEYRVDADGLLELDVLRTANCRVEREIVNKTDVVTGIGCTAIGVVAGIGLLTPLAPLAGAALLWNGVIGGGYGACRGGYRLFDRSKHHQGLASGDCVFDWLSIVGTAASFGAMGAATVAARGVALSQSTRILLNTAIYGNLVVSGVSTSASISIMIKRWWVNGQKPSGLELVQAVSSFIFFSASVYTVKSAGRDVNTRGMVEMVAYIERMKRSGNYEGRFAPRGKAANRHATPANGYSKDANGRVRPSADTQTLKQHHKDTVRARGQAGRPVDKQSPTTTIDMHPEDLQNKINRVLNSGKGGSWTEGSRPGERIVNLDFSTDPQTGAHVTSLANGDASVSRVSMNRVSLVVNENGQPVHLRSADSQWTRLLNTDSRVQNMQHMPAYVEPRGATIILHGVLPPNEGRLRVADYDDQCGDETDGEETTA